MNNIRTAVIQIAAVAAVAYLHVGQLWITEGYGLHPIIAGAVAGALILAPYFLPRWFR
jgi:hypothetical protein